MKRLFSILLVLLATIMVSPAPTYYFNRFTTNTDGSVFVGKVLTNGETANVNFIGAVSNSAYVANAGVVTNWGNEYGVNETNTGTIQASQFVAPVGAGLPSVFENSVNFNNAYSQSNAGNVQVTGRITNSVLTASRMIISDANKAFTSAAASGAVPIDADGTATTAAQLAAIFPGGVIHTNLMSILATFVTGISNNGTFTQTGNFTNAALTASRIVLSDANKALTSAAASGAVPVDADGSSTTFAQVNALAPSAVVTQGFSLSLTLSNDTTIDGAHRLIVNRATASRIATLDANNAVTNLNSISAGTALQLSGNNLIPITTEVITNARASAWDGTGISNNWVMTPYFGSIQNIQLQNGNRFISPFGPSTATNLIQLVGLPLPSGGYLSNLTVRCSTNNFSTTNYTFTLLTNNAAVNPVPTPVASLLTTTLLGATANAVTNGAGLSCILPARSATVDTFGVMQILNSVANTTQPQTFSWRMEWWHQQFNP